jgi:alpha-mannosidase
MNNHWHTNYKADQEGPTVFRYVICPHDAFDFTAAQRFGIERSQPLIAAPATEKPTVSGLPFRMDLGPAIVTSLRPTDDGRDLLVRLFNPTSDTVRVDLKQDTAASHAIRRCGLFGEADGAPVKALDLPPWGFATLRWERQ